MSTDTPPLYEPLNMAKAQIRLLTLNLGGKDGPISCNLTTHSLDDKPHYEAVSYVWGDASVTEPITVNGHAFSATVNLVGALKRLRLLRHSRPMTYLWIDAICINQDDPKEKGYQVNMMGRIFSHTLRALIWLGDIPAVDDASCGRLFQAIATIPSRMTMSVGMPTRGGIVRCTEAFFGSAWFSRTWTVQEALLPPDLLFILGPGFASLDEVMGWLQVGLVSQKDTPPQSAPQLSPTNAAPVEVQPGSDRAIRAYFQSRGAQSGFHLTHKLRAGGRRCTLLEALCEFWDRKCTMPQDKVYALLGIIASGEWFKYGESRLSADYSLTPSEVYLAAGRALAQAFGGMVPMLKVAISAGSLPQCPCWVPRFGPDVLTEMPSLSSIYGQPPIYPVVDDVIFFDSYSLGTVNFIQDGRGDLDGVQQYERFVATLMLLAEDDKFLKFDIVCLWDSYLKSVFGEGKNSILAIFHGEEVDGNGRYAKIIAPRWGELLKDRPPSFQVRFLHQRHKALAARVEKSSGALALAEVDMFLDQHRPPNFSKEQKLTVDELRGILMPWILYMAASLEDELAEPELVLASSIQVALVNEADGLFRAAVIDRASKRPGCNFF